LPERQRTPGPQSLSKAHEPAAAAHFPDRQVPPPQSESKAQLPSGALAHLPERQRAPPQSESKAHELPAAVAHLPERQRTPGPQSESNEQVPPPARAVDSVETNSAAATRTRPRRTRSVVISVNHTSAAAGGTISLDAH
jgi:hypothetical protein